MTVPVYVGFEQINGEARMQEHPALKLTDAERAAGVTPVNYAYPPGYLLRYGLVTLGAGVSSAARTVNLAALNTATRVCAYGKDILLLPPGTLEINGTWDCTANSGASTTTNGGLWIRGCGKVNSIIQYIAGANNTGIAWDQTGLAFGRFEAFAFIGGASTSDCPKVTMLQGATNSGGFIFSGNSLFQDITLQGYGDYVWYNAGCEAQTFVDCSLYAWRDQSFVNAQPIVFVASGSTPTETSAIVTTNSPINSMTLIRWFGAKAAMLFFGSIGINFHFTAGAVGACADIRIDDWMQVLTASGSFKFMSDDSGGATAGCALFRCGGERLIIEAATANQDIRICDFNVPVAEGLWFDGRAAAGHAIVARPFQFGATCVPTNCWFDWHPNVSSTWTGDYIVQCGGTENGIHVRAPVTVANLINVTTSRTINSFPGFGYSASGTDYAAVQAMTLNVGPAVDAQFNRTMVIRAGAFVSANSDGSLGIQTTQSVSTSATVILNVPGLASLVIVTGVSGADKFTDLVMAGFSGTPSAILSRTESGGPAARTYSAVSGTLKLAMASGTYAIECTVFGGGMQT
jgi:hypothetical protein